MGSILQQDSDPLTTQVGVPPSLYDCWDEGPAPRNVPTMLRSVLFFAFFSSSAKLPKRDQNLWQRILSILET